MADRKRTYNVVIRRGETAGLSFFQNGAENLHSANELAVEVVARLSPEIIGRSAWMLHVNG